MLLFGVPEMKVDESRLGKWCDHDGPGKNGHLCVAAKCLLATERWQMYAWSLVPTDGQGQDRPEDVEHREGLPPTPHFGRYRMFPGSH